MPVQVPPIPRVDSQPAEYEALRQLLRLSGFSEPAVCDRLQIGKLSDLRPEQLRQHDSGPLRSASDALTKLFIEGWPVSRSSLAELLTSEGLDLLDRFGLIMPFGNGDEAAATVSLYPIEDLFVASDRYNNADGSYYEVWDDLVYPCLFVTTRKFIETIPRTATGDVLDLCAGSGIGALLLARTAQKVVAADLTERCRYFIHFNARVNGFDNIEPAIGDLYAPVAGQQFDRIVVHPPYQPVLDHIATFNSGGADGEQITRRIITEAPGYLKPGGQLFCLCQLTDREDPVEVRIRNWMTDEHAGLCDIGFVVYTHHDMVRYTAVETLQEKKPHGAWRAWIQALTNAGVRDMVYGMVVVQMREHGSADRHAFTVRREGPHTGSSELVQLIAAETRVSQADFPQRMLSLRFLARPGSTLQVTHQLEAGKWEQASLVLKRSQPFEYHLSADQLLANLLAHLDGKHTGEEIRQSLPFAVTPEQLAGVFRRLVSGGFVDIID